VRFLKTRADKYFVKTKLNNEASEKLAEKHIVILTGHPGEGKTAIAANLALDGGTRPENCVKLESARDWEDVNWSLRCFSTVIIDDIFGGVSLDHERLSDWKRVLNDIEQRAKVKELKVIITSRRHIIEEANEDMDKITMFNKKMVHLDSRYLTANEMKQILNAILERNDIKEDVDLDDCVEKARGVINIRSGEREEIVFGFPECAVLFATETLMIHGPDFFKKPECHFKGYIEQLYKSKDNEQFYKFIALVVVWAQKDQKINETDLKNSKDISSHIQDVADCFGIGIDRKLIETLKCALKAYTTYLLMYINSSGEYMFSHNLIGEMVGVVLGKHKPRECIRLCQRDFLMERLTVTNNDEREDIEIKVVIPSRMYTDLCEKLTKMIFRDGCNEIENTYCNVVDIDVNVLNHDAFSRKHFVDVFIKYILGNNLSPKLFNDLRHYTFLGNTNMPMFVLDYILKNERLVLAEQSIVNIKQLHMPDTHVSGDSICTVMRKLPFLLNTLLDSGRGQPNSECFGNKSDGSFSYPLIVATSENLIESVSCLLLHGAEPNKADSKGETALHYAVKIGNQKIYEELVRYGANENLLDSALHYAVRNGQHTRMLELVNLKDNINIINKKGKTPLHLAASRGNLQSVSILVSNGADANIVDNAKNTALHLALRKGNRESLEARELAANEGHCEVIAELLKSKADVNSRNSNRNTPLHLAALNGYKDAVDMLLKSGADVNSMNIESCTALHLAASNGHCEIIMELLNSKADVNVKNNHNNTPLYLAACNGYTDAVNMLLKRGADVNIMNNYNRTALHQAASEGHCDVVEELLNNKADINAKDGKGDTPLQFATIKGHTDSVKMLLESDADVNSMNKDNYTALHSAASKGHCEIIEELLNSKADVNAKDSIGDTPLHDAALNGYTDAVNMLLKRSADVNIMNNVNCTALHWAAGKGHCKVIEELLNSKADVNANDSSGDTPLHVAAYNGYTDAVNMLLKCGADVSIWNKDKKTALHFAVSLQADRRYDIINELLHFHADVNVKDINGETPLQVGHRMKDKEAVRILINNGATTNEENDV